MSDENPSLDDVSQSEADLVFEIVDSETGDPIEGARVDVEQE